MGRFARALLTVVSGAAAVACSEDATDPSGSRSASSSGSSSSTSSSSGGGADGGSSSGASSGGLSDAGNDARVPGAGSGGTGGLIGASVTLAGCADCRVHVPTGYAPGKPAPLVLALHGDEGPASGVPGVIQLWSAGADAHGYLVLAVPCSPELDCTDGNYSGWLAGQSYQVTAAHIAKINGWADAMESLYDVDTKREYLAGHSGGAYVLGYFAQAQADRYAAVAFVAGGMPAWTGTGHACPTTKIPGYFLGGDKDPRTGGQMSDTASSFQTCGQEINLDLVANADHGQTIATLGTGKADAILTWFDARPKK